MIKCIIFDCDGTLVDSEFLCNLGLEIKLREIQIEESAQEMMIQYRGGKLSEILKSLELKHNVVLDENFVKSYRAMVEKLFEKKLKPINGIVNTLEKLDLPLCVASSGPLKKVEKSLSLTNLNIFLMIIYLAPMRLIHGNRNQGYSFTLLKKWVFPQINVQ